MLESELQTLIAELPELYQPVYGHPEISCAARRGCDDRMRSIRQLVELLTAELGRPLRVLDLGCAQGFFTFQLAALGASVYGVDRDHQSIALCRALASENPDLDVSFAEAELAAVVPAVTAGQYDLVLGLSVFHHLVYEHGVDAVRAWLTQLADHVAVLVLELALADEPLYWAPAQPKDPLEMLQSAAFVHVLGRYGTHLSEIERPLVVASQHYWLLPPYIGKIDKHLTSPHAIAGDHYRQTRHYYFSGDRFLKYFRLGSSDLFNNAAELAREAAVLAAPPPGLQAPELISHQQDRDAAWLLRSCIRGRLLLDALRESDSPAVQQIVLDVLRQLVVLEEADCYHDDLRPWNLLLRDDGQVQLIDFGAISHAPKDRAWPDDVHLSFLILVHELLQQDIQHPEPLRPAMISPWCFPEPWFQWVIGLWNTPVAEWRFAWMRDELLRALDAESSVPALLPSQWWQGKIQSAVSILSKAHAYQRWQLELQQDCIDRQRAQIWHLQQDLKMLFESGDMARQQLDAWRGQQDRWRGQQDRWRGQQDGWREQQDVWREQQDGWREQQDGWREECLRRIESLENRTVSLCAESARAAALQQQLFAVYASWSWRIMAPLRWLLDLLTPQRKEVAAPTITSATVVGDVIAPDVNGGGPSADVPAGEDIGAGVRLDEGDLSAEVLRAKRLLQAAGGKPSNHEGHEDTH